MAAAATLLLVLACIVIVLVGAGRRAYVRDRAAKANGSFARQFVWVKDDGSVRELTTDELAYLNTEFHPADGARPYIRARYSARSPDDRLSGFLPRSKLPRKVIVRP
jgi:predicted metal-dependent hydrolase